jgi:hypothetical protein
MQQTAFNNRRTRRASATESSPVGLNTELEKFLNVNASEAYQRPWHRLERGLRLNRIRKFVDSERQRMGLTDEDADALKQRLEKALDKKMLNSKTCVVYDMEKEEIQEIKGLVYHKTAEGRILSSIVDKKSAVTFRKKPLKATSGTAAAAAAQAVDELNMKPEGAPGDGPQA